MATDLVFNDSFIDKFKGKYWAYQRDNGTDTWHTGVGLIKIAPAFSQESNPIIWGDGSQGPSIDEPVKTQFVITTPDDSGTLHKFLKDETINQSFRIIIQYGKYSENGVVYREYFHIADAKINRGFAPSDTREQDITIVPQENQSAVSLTGAISLSAWLPVSLSAVTIPALGYFSTTGVTV